MAAGFLFTTWHSLQRSFYGFIDTNDIVFYSQVLRHVNLIFFDKKNISCCIMMHHVYDASCVFYSCCLLEMFDIFICCWKKHPAVSCLLAEAGTTRWNANADGYSCWGHPKVESNHPDIQPASTSGVCAFVDNITFHPVKKRCLVDEMLLICTGNFTWNSTQIVSYIYTH